MAEEQPGDDLIPLEQHPGLRRIVVDRLVSWNSVASLGVAAISVWVCRHPERAQAIWQRLESIGSVRLVR